jgi:predicted  nucleic acid-binding Zn-ribbon protein
MTCPICTTIERDLNDVVRTLRKRMLAQTDACPAMMMDLEMEIRALSKAKIEIEANIQNIRNRATP